jgi:hypothetical protein
VTDELTKRFEGWVERVVQAGEFWIVIDDTEQNTVLEDPDEDRDLQLLYASEEDARRHGVDRPADAGKGLRPDAMPVADLPALCEPAEQRGEAFALWEGGSWVVAEPDLLREELEERLGS